MKKLFLLLLTFGIIATPQISLASEFFSDPPTQDIYLEGEPAQVQFQLHNTEVNYIYDFEVEIDIWPADNIESIETTFHRTERNRPQEQTEWTDSSGNRHINITEYMDITSDITLGRELPVFSYIITPKEEGIISIRYKEGSAKGHDIEAGIDKVVPLDIQDNPYGVPKMSFVYVKPEPLVVIPPAIGVPLGATPEIILIDVIEPEIPIDTPTIPSPETEITPEDTDLREEIIIEDEASAGEEVITEDRIRSEDFREESLLSNTANSETKTKNLLQNSMIPLALLGGVIIILLLVLIFKKKS
ncbi:MAG: hypothetical protein HOE80_04700 [Candidatus Magasanikbacteria bacterium]|jgi:hypothetical protein|nr:hypothetical protein [Candidatus Magasanikbacteria bacterium]MBT4071989.1 hypothetical protein [Candidatus Magasanikbacteria bacterium]